MLLILCRPTASAQQGLLVLFSYWAVFCTAVFLWNQFASHSSLCTTLRTLQNNFYWWRWQWNYATWTSTMYLRIGTV